MGLVDSNSLGKLWLVIKLHDPHLCDPLQLLLRVHLADTNRSVLNNKFFIVLYVKLFVIPPECFL